MNNLHFLVGYNSPCRLRIVTHSAQISRDLFGNFIRFRCNHENPFPAKPPSPTISMTTGVNQDKEEV